MDNKIIREATEAFRDAALHFFKYQPLNQIILETYNEFTNVTLDKIIQIPLSFQTSNLYGLITFENVVKFAPLKGPIVQANEMTLIRELQTKYNLMRSEMSKRGTLTVEDTERLAREESEERIKIMTNFHRSQPRSNWLTAADCREQDLDYMLSVYADIVITTAEKAAESLPNAKVVDTFTDDSNPNDISTIDLFESTDFIKQNVLHSQAKVTRRPFIKLFEVPLMLGSQWDWLILSGAPKEKWSHFGECDLNPMCNFILKGSEKVFVTQIKLAPNIPRCIIPSGAKSGDAPSVIAEIRCEAPSKRSSVLKMAFMRPKGPNQIKGAKLLMMSLGFLVHRGKKSQGEGDVSKPKNMKDLTFNVLWIFRIYIIHTAMQADVQVNSVELMLTEFNAYLKDACQRQRDVDDVNVYRRVVEELLDTIRHARASDKSPADDNEFIKILMKEYNYFGLTSSAPISAGIQRLMKSLDADFMSHIVTTEEYELPNPNEPWKPYPKFTAFVHMIVKYVKCYAGAKPVDDLNHFATQQMATAGIELGILIQKAFNYVRRKIQYTLENGEEVDKFTWETTIPKFGESSVTKPVATAFRTGQWGLDRGKKRDGVVQQHDQSSKNAQWSIIRKAAIPMKKQSQISVPRQVHHTGLGIVDPTNTPDSAQVGLVKYFAVSCFVTREDDVAYREIMNFFTEKIEDGEITSSREDVENAIPIVINNIIIGYGSEDLAIELRNGKREGVFGKYTEIFVKIENDQWESVKELHVMTTAGRAMRPLYIVKDQKIPALDLLTGEHGRTYRRRFDLLLNEGVVEYVSASEFEYSNVAETYKDFVLKVARGMRIDYVEMDPSFIMSIEIAAIPYPQLNPNPRILYGAGMSKQPMGVPNATFMNRQDTDFKILTYPHKPLVTTDMTKIIGLDQQPYGANVTVAILSVSGTDEDATVWRKGFYEMGGLNGTLYETISDIKYSSLAPDALTDPAVYDNGLIRIRKRSEEEVAEILAEREEDERILAESVNPATGVASSPAIDNKEIKEFAEKEEQTERPFPNIPTLTGKTSTLVRPGDVLVAFKARQEDGTEIERYKLSGKRSGFIHSIHTIDGSEKTLKIVVRFPHHPKQGDKFANRFAQKGVVGDVIPDVDMPFTVVPPYGIEKSITPDVIFSPTSYASRMTGGMTAEILTGSAMVACDTRRFVSKLVRWERGMMNVEMQITDDFWIILEDILVNPNPSGKLAKRQYLTEEQIFSIASKSAIEKMDEEKLAIVQSVINNRLNPEFLQDIDRAPIDNLERVVYDELEAAKASFEFNLFEDGWKQAHGIRFPVNGFKFRYTVPDTFTVLKTGEKAILFSQLPAKTQIEWYQLHSNDIVPNYLMRYGADVRYPNLEPHPELGDATAFRNPDYGELGRVLREKGFYYKGERLMISGESGKRIKCHIFIGPCYWMHLKHLTDSKFQTRDVGSMSVTKRGTTQGKKLGGAVRSGEMSHAAMMAHGNMSYLAERFMTAADKAVILVCTKCGGQCYTGGRVPKPICETCGSKENPHRVTMPYSGIRFLSIMTASGQRPHFTTRDHPDYENLEEGEFKFDDENGEPKERITF